MTLILLLSLFFSCQEEIKYEEEQYKRIIGFEGSSIVEQITELDNGDLMMIGKIGVSAHSLISTVTGVEINEVEDQGPFIAITDHNGYVKKIKSYPLEDFEKIDEIKVFNMPNKLTFMDILKNPNGGYHVLGELSGFDFQVTIPQLGIDTLMESIPGYSQRTPLLFELDEHLEIQKIISFNAYEGWDFIIRNKPIMKPLSEDEFIILFCNKQTLLPAANIGYSFFHLTHQLDTLGLYENFDNSNDKFAYDFDIHDGQITVLGTEGGGFYLYQHDMNSQFSVTNSRYVSEDGEAGSNTNPHYLRVLANGNLGAIYTDPFNVIKGDIYNAQLEPIYKFEIDGAFPGTTTIRAPRAFAEMANGDLLLYSIVIPDNDDPISGQVIRTTQTGENIFNLNIAGSPGDVLELSDGQILFASNAVHNELLQRITLYKVNQNGTLY